MRNSIINLSLALLLMVLLTACGSTAKTYNSSYTTTVGQELMDLRKARDQGAISDREYSEMKRKILERKQ